MKQEFVSAKCFVFKKISDKPSHYSDRDVVLLKCFRLSPAHAISIEKHLFHAV